VTKRETDYFNNLKNERVDVEWGMINRPRGIGGVKGPVKQKMALNKMGGKGLIGGPKPL